MAFSLGAGGGGGAGAVLGPVRALLVVLLVEVVTPASPDGVVEQILAMAIPELQARSQHLYKP